MFTNIAIRVRAQYKTSQTGDKQTYVLEFFDKVALLPDYNTIDISDFQQLSQTFRKNQENKKRDFTNTTQKYRSSSPPPKKQNVAPTQTNVRTEDINDNYNLDLDLELEGAELNEEGYLILINLEGDQVYASEAQLRRQEAINAQE